MVNAIVRPEVNVEAVGKHKHLEMHHNTNAFVDNKQRSECKEKAVKSTRLFHDKSFAMTGFIDKQ